MDVQVLVPKGMIPLRKRLSGGYEEPAGMGKHAAEQQRCSSWCRLPRYPIQGVSVVTGISLLLLFLGIAVGGEAGDREVLKGIRSLGVEVEDLPRMAEKLGIRQEVLRTDVVSRLRQAGIDVVSTDILKQNPSIPFLKVSLIIGYGKPTYIYAVLVGLNERVSLERDPRIISYAMPWWRIVRSEHAGESDIPGYVQETLHYILNEFIANYNEANPKEISPAVDLRQQP